MRVVIEKNTGKVVYKQSPEFEPGKGILNAHVMYGYDESQIEEVNLPSGEVDRRIFEANSEVRKEESIRSEGKAILRELAINSLTNKGKL
jgi:hypothetical protein